MIKRILRKLYRKLTLPVGHLKPEASCPTFWYGNDYGGFYLNPNLLSSSGVVYSLGIGQDISFDLAVISAHNCQVFGFDPTPKSINWIKEQSLPVEFHFEPVGIASVSGLMEFHLPANPDHVSGSIVSQKNVSESNKVMVSMKSLPDIMAQLGHDYIDVIKMDIEGAEYDVLEALVKSSIRPGQLLIEFHDRFFDEPEPRSRAIVEKLASVGYKIFAVSDSYEEISFVHLDHIRSDHRAR